MLYLSISITSLAVIAFQLAVMQILAITQWHHFAWMVISMAMLGFGAAGTVLFLLRRRIVPHFTTAYVVLLLAGAVAMNAAVRFTARAGAFDAFLLFFETRQVLLLLATYLMFSLPFFCVGLAITLAFYHAVERIGKIYFFNLSGSALGAVAGIALLHVLPPEYVPLVPAALLVVAAIPPGWPLVAPSRPGAPARRSVVLLILSVAVLSTVWNVLAPVTPRASQYKDISAALELPGASVVHRTAGPFGQLEVVRAETLRYDPGLSLQYRREPPVRDVVFVDGMYFGTLLGFDPDATEHILDHTTRVLPYAARSPDTVVVLGAGTGPDVSRALNRGADRVIAVEPNRDAARLLTSEHPGWIDDLYRHPAVTLETATIRRFLGARPDLTADLVVLPEIGRFGGTSGVNALEEQYHLTREAFRAIFRRLNPRGMLAVTVWTEDPPRPSLRVLNTIQELLREHGVEEIHRHLIAIRSWNTVTFVAGIDPFTDEEINRVRGYAKELGFDPLVLPDIAHEERTRFNRRADETYFTLVDEILGKNERIRDDQGDRSALRSYPFDLKPTGDRAPFFNHFLKPARIPHLRDTYGARALPYLELGFFLALAAAVQAILAALVLVVVPLAGTRWRGANRGATFLFFLGTGAGFMVFEVALIQQLILYLGTPVYATAAVLALLLVSSGVGSYLSSGLNPTRRALMIPAAAAALAIALVSVVVQPILYATVSAHLFLRGALVLVLTAGPGMLMGMLFPLGLRRLAHRREEHIPWACAIDSSLAVSVTAPATLFALTAGFDAVMVSAAGAYVLVALASLRLGGTAPTR